MDCSPKRAQNSMWEWAEHIYQRLLFIDRDVNSSLKTCWFLFLKCTMHVITCHDCHPCAGEVLLSSTETA
jgi:hypothetical protein